MRPLFSIICTVKNRAALIRPCVESVLAQDDPAVEFIVQDGASSDGTLAILREYGDRIRLVSEPDDGAGDGLFRALRRARGTFWGSCFSDEQLAPDAVSWARHTFAEHPDLGAIYGYAEGVDHEGTHLSRQDAGELSIEHLLTYRQLPPFVATFFRMSSYRQLGLWEYTGGGEIDLWSRFAVRFPIRRFPKLVAYYGLDRSVLSNQVPVYEAERLPRLENLRRLFHDDPAGQRFQHLETRATAGYFLRVAGMFVRNGEWELARKAFREASIHWPACAADWLQDGEARIISLQRRLASVPRSPASVSASPGHLDTLLQHQRSPSPQSCARLLDVFSAQTEALGSAWLHYTVDQPFNLWTVLPSLGVRRVAIFGGEGWGLALQRQLPSAGVECEAVIENNASTRRAAMIPAPYFSLPDYLASGTIVDAVLSSLLGAHDRDILPPLQGDLGLATPVLSWKMLLSLIADPTDLSSA